MGRKPILDDTPRIEFAKRLNSLCDKPGGMVPPLNKGRLIWIKDQLESRFGIEIGKETVRKWLSGSTIPSHETLIALAQIFDVDEGWLTFGSKSGVDPSKRNTKMLHENGAITVVAGLLQLSGYFCAFPDETDKNKSVDLYGFKNQRNHKIVARQMLPASGKYRIEIPNDYKGMAIIGMLYEDFETLELVKIPENVIDQHGTARGPYIELSLTNKGDGEWGVGRHNLKSITNLSDGL